jgi:bacteriocin biosynthesis cyclodehydratase domain-containing protein
MAEHRTLRIKRQYSIVAHSPHVVELRGGVWNATSFTLTDESESGHLYRVLARLDGSMSPVEIARREQVPEEEVQALLDHLVQLDVVESSAASALDYYLDQLVPHLGQRAAADRACSAVTIVGDAALGTEIRRQLTASLPDLDVSEAAAGDPALAALAAGDTGWLTSSLEFEKRIEAFEGWRERLVVVALTVINPVLLQSWNRVSLALDIPWIHAALDGPFVLVGPVVVPRRTACFECFEARVTMNLREAASYQAYKRALVEGEIRYGPLPVQPALAGLLASLTSLEALNFLLTRSGFTVGKALAIHLPTMEFTFNEVLRVPGCPACGSRAARDERQLYFDVRGLIRSQA